MTDLVVFGASCVVVGLAAGVLIGLWFLFSKRSPIFATERWWMETADRWEWLRQSERREDPR